ncbi:MAG: DUF1254 domain-containing protein [Candidatus Hydrogenedentes bacterium]|nr:DUF1254 domain-containing protein [Candidatus Hydrogenedentota bacterium]
MNRSILAAIVLVVMAGVQFVLADAAKAPAGEKDIDQIAVDAYIYTYPLVVMDVTRRSMSLPITVAGIGPVNSFNHLREFPKAQFKSVVRPNFDTLYSSAWLDLAKEPVIVTIPDTADRYYLLQMLDMWTDVFAAPGKRTIGTKGATIGIVPLGWSGTLPSGIEKVEAPTPNAWIIGRTQTNGEDDFSAVHKIQDGYTVTPLSRWSVTGESRKENGQPSENNEVEPTGKPEAMTAEEYFTYAANLLRANPPHASDSAILVRLERIGLSPDIDFDFVKLDPAIKQALENAPASGLKLIQEKEPAVSRIVNGWRLNNETMGVYGNDYLKRAIIAKTALGANIPEDAVYPMAFVDGDGAPLNGENRYVQHFEKDGLPPVEAFWSITLYKEDGFPADNKANRFAIGDRDALKFNPDGSLDIYIQHESPGEEKQSNWLPAPDNSFNLTMRLYWPKKAVLDGVWAPPPVKRVE